MWKLAWTSRQHKAKALSVRHQIEALHIHLRIRHLACLAIRVLLAPVFSSHCAFLAKVLQDIALLRGTCDIASNNQPPTIMSQGSGSIRFHSLEMQSPLSDVPFELPPSDADRVIQEASSCGQREACSEEMWAKDRIHR